MFCHTCAVSLWPSPLSMCPAIRPTPSHTVEASVLPFDEDLEAAVTVTEGAEASRSNTFVSWAPWDSVHSPTQEGAPGPDGSRGLPAVSEQGWAVSILFAGHLDSGLIVPATEERKLLGPVFD